MTTYIAAFGLGRLWPGDTEPTMSETTDQSYYDSWRCMVMDLAIDGYDTTETAGTLIDTTSIDDRGDSRMVSFGQCPAPDTSGHEWCPTCGVLVRHGGGDDSDFYTCNDNGCDAPERIEL